MHYKTLVCDVDEVLAHLVRPYADFLSREHGIPVTPASFGRYFLSDSIGISLAEAQRLILTFYRTGFASSREPMEGAVETLSHLKMDGFRLVAASIQPDDYVSDVRRWLEANFCGIFDEIDICPWSDITPRDEVCTVYGAKLLVDDRTENVERVADRCNSTVPILFGNYVWNEGCRDGIVRVAGWEDVRHVVEELEKG